MTKTNSRSLNVETAKGAGCIALFGLPFALTGAGIGLYVCWVFFSALAMRTWEPVPVNIQHAEFKTHRGDDSTTYSVAATYSYEVAGVPYTSNRVGISGGSDSLEGYHRKIFAKLDAHRRSGKSYTGYYNPREPADAVLVREVRLLISAIMMLFPAIFWPVGATFVGAAFWGAAAIREEDNSKERYPDEPWRWRSDWKDGYCAGPESKNISMLLFLTLPIYTLPTILIIFALWQVQAGNYVEAMIAIPWVIIQIVTIAYFIILRGRMQRYGKTTLELRTIPIHSGGTMEATLRTEGALPYRDPIEFEVTCVKKVTVSSGKNKSTTRSELWKRTWSIDANEVDHRGHGSAVPFTIRIAPGLPTRFDTRDATEIEWKLSARCRTAGYDFATSFDLPVFGSDTGAQAPESEPSTVQAEPVSFNPKVLRVQEAIGGGMEFDFYRGRFLGTSLLLFFFVLIFGGATTAMTIQGGAPIFMMIIFGAISFGMLLAAIQSLTGSIKTTIAYDELTVERVLLLRRTTRTVPRAQLKDIIVSDGMTVNSQQYFDLYATLSDDKRIKLGNNFPSKHEADAIAAMMRVGMGMDDPDTGPQSVAPEES